MAEAPDSVLEQIQKLLKLASRNTNEHEAAAASAKAQELLTKWNLTFEAVENASVGSGAREQAAVEGGFHKFERELWKSVAELNFCIYWCERVWNREGRKDKYGTVRIWKFQHFLVGRKVNVAATRAMADYLSKEVTRLAKERTRGMNSVYSLSNWANSYRRGITHRVCRKLREERNSALEAEEARAAAAARAADGPVSTETAVSLHVYIDRETDANIDFMYGEGTSARWAAERAEKAARAKAREEEYTRWAAEHPEEAAAQERKRREQLSGRRARGGRSDPDVDRGAYWAGYEAGEHVSIHRQVDDPISGRIGHG